MKSKKKRKREKEFLEEILNLEKSLAVFPKSDTQNLLDNKKMELEKNYRKFKCWSNVTI